ncbi:MAG: molybdenum ABC transporter permease subunit [Acidobacteria bacterium 13_1_40CM_65_14]|nr:MAG: molybdenum ABC transporter permease subunit [Acidobacteria bacterium 13_1_40CM_65_14]OLC76113.1 MAG: molybdenum ABC transporter permease subunit [Acidobacteria bacterium 13_1_40CM_4_65_8]OLD21767.1 MAG: molybdenum ABC transporter permease subunit [Acidobacteria bacterium 13_1_40CM_3_65_5]OLE78846.1 MAG: molybdenum ABC transporter permease subunit [Acidobacteria bacterium 13_1_20CM_2_65_9]
MDWTALWLSVRLATATTLVLLAVGVPIAYWIVYSPRRWKFLVEAIVALPLVLPPTVLGFYVLIAIGPMSPVGRAYARLVGHGLPFTFEGLLIASVLYSMPFAVQPFSAEFASVDRRLLEASWSLGVSRLATFRRVVLPLSIRGLVTGIVLSFAHTLGEFGVVLMVGGNVPGVTRTVSISIYDAVQSLDYQSAARTSALLLVISFVILAITYSLQRTVWVRTQQ